MPTLNDQQVKRLSDALWADSAISVVAVLDGAANPQLLERLYAQPGLKFESLMGDYLEPDLAEVAPYAVELRRDTAFSDWLLANMWGEHWGIVARSTEGFAPAARRFRSLFIAIGPDEQPLYFRFYDPRALRIVAPTCGADQLGEIFDGLAEIWLEGEQPDSVSVYSSRGDALIARDAKL